MFLYYNDIELKISASENNIHINNSFKIRGRKNIMCVIKQVKEIFPNHLVSSISNYLLVNEWACHNMCYKLGIYKERTKHTDLNCDNPWWLKIGYLIIGSFYF